MNFVSIRVITDDVARLVAFYEQVTGVTAAWSTPDFAELTTPACTLAIASTRTVALFGTDSARPAANHSVITEFRVADVDAEYDRLAPSTASSSRSRRRCRGATARSSSGTPMAT